MSFSFDTNSNVGKVRSLCGDTEEEGALLSDEQINVFLDLQSNDILKSAAMALRAMAAKIAVTEKSIKAGNYWEDNKGQSKALFDMADQLDEMANNTPYDAAVEIIYNQFNYNQIFRNKILRGESIE